MRDFVMEFLRDDFELVQPKPHCQTYYMIALRHISRHQQQPWLAADDIAKAAGGANKAHASAESGSLADGEDQLLEQLISPHQSQQQQLASSLPQVSQEQLFAEHESELWLDPVPQNTWASALSRPVDSVLLDLHSGLSAGPTSPQPPPPPQTSAAAGSARHCAWSGASVFERLSSPRETVLCHSASWPNRGLLARRGSVATPDISLQLAEDLDLAIIALFLQHAKEQQQAAMIFLEEGEVPTTLQVAPVTGLSTEDQHLIDSLGSISMPCAVFTECLLQSSCVNTDDQRSLFSDWLGYLCDSGVLIQGSDAVDDAAAAAMAAEASMSIRLDVAAMLQRLLKHNQLQGLIPQIEQALVNHLSAKTNFQGHLGVPRLEVGTATNCLRADLPQLRPYLLVGTCSCNSGPHLHCAAGPGVVQHNDCCWVWFPVIVRSSRCACCAHLFVVIWVHALGNSMSGPASCYHNSHPASAMGHVGHSFTNEIATAATCCSCRASCESWCARAA